jgi:transcriptional regulator with GAF, ATPase, and Fis domain
MNVRELEQRLKVGALLAQGNRLELAAAAEGNPDASLAAGPPPHERPRTLEDERLVQQLVAKLTEHGGNVTQVARSLGKDRRQVQRWMKRFAIGHSRG